MSIFYQEWAGGSFNNDGWWSWQEGNQQDCREIYWRNWQVRGESIMDLWFKLIKSDDLFLYLRMIWFLSMNLSRWWTSVMLKRKCQWSLEDNCRFLAPSLCIHNKRKYKFEFLFKLLRATINFCINAIGIGLHTTDLWMTNCLESQCSPGDWNEERW